MPNKYSCFDCWSHFGIIASSNSLTDSNLRLLIETEQDRTRHSFIQYDNDNISNIFSGLLPREECSKPVCTSTQDPKVDNCHLDDGYTRLFLYRSWNTSCYPLQNDLSRYQFRQLTFYEQLLHTKVFFTAFFLCTVWLCNFLAHEYWCKSCS